jgi:hypothetical protein
MPCSEIKAAKYQIRKSPPFHAGNCKDLTKKGKDGDYVSKPDAKGIYKWVKKSATRKVGKIRDPIWNHYCHLRPPAERKNCLKQKKPKTSKIIEPVFSYTNTGKPYVTLKNGKRFYTDEIKEWRQLGPNEWEAMSFQLEFTRLDLKPEVK